MYIKFRCSKCGHKLKAPLSWAGRRARCPACADTSTVPVLGVIRLARMARTPPSIKQPPLPVAVPVNGAAMVATTAATAAENGRRTLATPANDAIVVKAVVLAASE